MSYILQALKKSEQERELAAQESLVIVTKTTSAAVQADELLTDDGGDKKIPLSTYGWLGAFFMVLLLISGYVQQQAGALQSGKGSMAGEVILEPVLSQPVAREIVAQEMVVKAVVVAKSVVEKVVVQQTPVKLVRPQVAVEQATKDVQALIPDINISSHIYSSLATRRSIVVNGERLVEADFITPHVQVKEITHQGMIIDVNGWPLVVDRSRGWSR
jgi:general secretion pathway protein B